MKYELVIFDFDGTLADSFPWFLSVMGGVADRYRFKRLDPGELEAVRGYDARRFLRHIGLPMWKVPLVAAHVRRLQARDLGQIRLFPGAAELLQMLVDRGVVVAIVSSNSEANIRAVLGRQTASLVAHYACSASVLGKRPKIRRVLRRSGIPAGRAILIGDETRDIDAAKAAGVASGAVAWGYGEVESLRAHAPTEVFETFDDLRRRLT